MVEALSTTLRRGVRPVVVLVLGALLAFLALSPAVFAHRLDEYLQATLVVIEPGSVRLQINLTPGVAVAERVLRDLDQDRGGTISRSEAARYGQRLKRDLTLRLDGRRRRLKLTASEFPEPGELRSGLGIIQLEFAATHQPLAPGPHRLTFENRHRQPVSVYLFNAARPKVRTIQITSQKRSPNQSAGEIEFTSLPSDGDNPASR